MKSSSLYNKIFLIFIITIIVSISLISVYSIKSTSDAYTDSAYQISMKNTKSIEVEMKRKLEHVPKDILYMTNFYALEKFFIWKSMGEVNKANEWRQVYSDALIDFLNSKKDYYQARVISLDGKEIIKATYYSSSDEARLSTDTELQNKAGRDYVEKAKLLKKGEFFISKMNLNIENGKIQKPYTPVIRYSSPIVDSNGILVAVFVINYYADEILNIIQTKIDKSKNSDISYYLLDKNSNYLFHVNRSKRWNAQLKNGFNFKSEYFAIEKNIQQNLSGSFLKNGNIYSYQKIYPMKDHKENYWYIVSSVNEAVALSKLDDFKDFFILLVLVIILVSYIVIRYFILKMTEPLTEVTKQLKALSNGEILKTEIDYEYNDEIGQIVRSTHKVVSAIEKTIHQANSVASGDFSQEIELLGHNDKLGLAITDMTNRLKEIAQLAQNLSVGNYDTKIIAQSSDDKLGIALLNMISYLKSITDVAEAISRGEISLDYSPVGKNDTLGKSMLDMLGYLKMILLHSESISKDDFSHEIILQSNKDELGLAISKMTKILSYNFDKNKKENYFSEGIAIFTDKLSGITDPLDLAQNAMSMAGRYVDAVKGVSYMFDKENKELKLSASFAFENRNELPVVIQLGEGVIGQVGLERKYILLKDVKDKNYLVKTATISSLPKDIIIFPLLHEDELFGVVEFISLGGFSDIQKDYLLKASSIFALALYSTIQTKQIKILLNQSQKAFEELQTQSEELQETNVQMEEQQQQLTLQTQEMKKQNEALSDAKIEIDERVVEIEKASRYKNEFLANMSHELRTPLNSIILLSKLLSKNQSQTLSTSDIEKTDVINRAGNDLLLLINDILDLSKVESGNMELDNSYVSSSDIIDELEGLFSVIASEKAVAFDIDDRFNSNFMIDKTKFLQVLKNLLSNAFKFTKEGAVSLSIFKVNENIVFEVADSGIGIPQNKLDTIFEAFKQVDGSISREFGGTGLGLSISKTIVELMQGTIEVESIEGEGSRFIVTLNLHEQDETPLIKEPSIENIKESELLKINTISMIDENNDISHLENELLGKNILIVDDDSRNIFALTSVLESMEAEVFSAFDGKEAIEVLEEEYGIDIILMDIMMPVMDGIDTIKAIRSMDKYKEIPIIAVTAKMMPEDKEACFDAGADDYLAKPIDNVALVSMIKALVE